MDTHLYLIELKNRQMKKEHSFKSNLNRITVDIGVFVIFFLVTMLFVFTIISSF